MKRVVHRYYQLNVNIEGKIPTGDIALKQRPKTDEMVAKGSKMG